MPSTNTLKDVLDRARAFLNDQGGMIWPDPLLLPHAKTAYMWAGALLSNNDLMLYEKVVGTPFSTDLTYTANQVDLSNVIPADMWVPTRLDFRTSQSDDWRQVNRVAELQTQVQPEEGMIRQWMYIDRDIYVTPITNSGFLRLWYLSLLPTLSDGSSPMLMDNAVEALAYYAAYSAYSSRGQAQQAAAMLGSDDPANPAYLSGARGLLGILIRVLVKNQQTIATRGQRFDSGRYYGSFGPWSL